MKKGVPAARTNLASLLASGDDLERLEFQNKPSTKQDEDANTAIARVFVDRYGMPKNYSRRDITWTLRSPDFAMADGTNLALYRLPKTNCTYVLSDFTGGIKSHCAD